MTYCGRDGRLSRQSLENRVNGALQESFFLPKVTYNALGDVTELDYPRCTHAACTSVPGAASPRTVTSSYTNGFLTAVGIPGNAGAYSGSITYHPNLMVNQVAHGNTLTDTYANDPNSMRRPGSIMVTSPTAAVHWNTGNYAFDGAGNIKSIGTHSFVYDKVSRLKTANLYLEPTSSVNLRTQTYTFDAFGNIQSIGGSSARNTPTSSATNRLTAGGYDAAGNLTSWNFNTYQYDPFNLMWNYRTGSDEWVYLYTADDERVWSFNTDNTSLWTLRGPDAKVLREYTSDATWAVASDYIYRDGSLLATETAQGTRHFHLDHLGTPRLITASGGSGGDFYTLTPCRVIDTRDQFAPIGALQTRTVQMTGACGIPAEATAVSVNLTAVSPTADGDLTAFPANEPRPTASAISYRANLTRANNAVLKLGNGALAFFANQPSGSVHLIVDVNGYFIEEGAGSVVAYHVYYPFGEEATAFNQDAVRMKFTGHERDLGNSDGAGDDLDYMHARFCSPITGRFLSTDPADSARRSQPQAWNMYAYALNNPSRYVDPDGQDEREGLWAGVVVNNSSEVIWVAADVGKETVVIPLNPGESSATYFQDADAIVIDPGVASPQGALLAPSIEGESSGAFKVGVSVVEVENSGPMDLDLERSLGYLGSYLIGRSGFLDVKAAQKVNKNWVIPKDRQAAEKKKEELRKQVEEREKKRNEEEKRKQLQSKGPDTG
jgi:RHS repeat-associated protein